MADREHQSRHRKSVHRELTERHNAAFVDGVCHAIDVVREAEGDAAADRLLARLFAEVGGVAADV